MKQHLEAILAIITQFHPKYTEPNVFIGEGLVNIGYFDDKTDITIYEDGIVHRWTSSDGPVNIPIPFAMSKAINDIINP